MAKETPVVFQRLPSDEGLLAEIGRIALVHSWLDYALRMTIKDLASVTPIEARDATSHQGSSELRKRVKNLGKLRLREGKALIRLEALLEQAARATGNRNHLLHSSWGTNIDGNDPFVLNDDHSFRAAPTKEELHETRLEIQEALSSLLHARSGGFLYEALNPKKLSLRSDLPESPPTISDEAALPAIPETDGEPYDGAPV